MIRLLESVNAVLWGLPVLLLITGVGIYLSLQSGFVQIRWFPKALRHFLNSLKVRPQGNCKVSGYRALCTALAATVGTGNLAGVAGAIAVGGPGVIFWMWMSGILGMVIKFAEVVLAMHFRRKNSAGELIGGPMYMIQDGLPKKYRYLAYIYCFFGVIASFGIGNGTQVNAVIGGIQSILSENGIMHSGIRNLIIGAALGIIVLTAFRGGASGIGSFTELLVPFAAVLYILLSIGVLIFRRDCLPEAISAIFTGAFSPKAVTGGMIVSVFQVIRVGTARGLFTNEAGMGTASIAHACADIDKPLMQGLLGIMEVFIDTILICTLTALVILCSGVPIAFGSDAGITLTMDAFSSVYGSWILIPVTVAVCLFAFATILGWGLYGSRCAQYLFGEGIWKVYVGLQVIVVVLGSVINTSTVWLLSEIVNALMVIPNLIAIAWLSPIFIAKIKEHKF